MRTIKVKLGKRSYNIIVGYDILRRLGKYIRKLNIGDDAYIISNATLKNKYGQMLKDALKRYGFSVRFKLIPDTEESKSIEMASAVINDIACYNKKRQVLIIAFGGGVIGDLAGFIASVYKRGIPYVQVPTTLLAQVDSSIGGKTAVDLTIGKNLVGTFYQPRLVFNDVKFLNTLNLRQLKSGLAEIIKYGLIKDRRLFVYLEKNHNAILNKKPAALEFIVGRCAHIKAKITQSDEREEKGVRTILNFGHTIGHAIEAAGNYKAYNHGEAIALGMLVVCDISRKLGFISRNVSQRTGDLIKAIGLPQIIEKVGILEIIKVHYRDKKFIGPVNKFVLLEDIGKAKVAKDIPLKIIKEALKIRLKRN